MNKTSSSFLFSRGVLALLGAFALTALAQPPPGSAEKSAPAAPAAAAEPPAPPPADAEKPSEERPMRRLDQPEPEPEQTQPNGRRTRRTSVHHGGPPFGDHAVTEGNRVGQAISIMGSTTVEGEVLSDAVSVMGNTTVARGAKVGGAAVAVLGRLEVRGDVRREAVSVLGSSFIDAHVGQEAVCVLGDLELGPNAVIDGDVVSVGGTLKKDPKAVINGNEVRVPFLGKQNMDWLVAYVRSCVMMARPLAIGPHLAWAWLIAFCFLAFYLLLALLFPAPLTKCVQTLETRPGMSLLWSVLAVLLIPVAIVLLCFTVIGVVLVPFVLLGLVFAALFGKATMLAWIGRRFTKLFGDGLFSHIFFAVLIGGLIVLLLYTVPVLGFLLLKLIGWLGMGVVVYTILQGMKRPKPAVAAVGATAGVATAGMPVSASTTMPEGAASMATMQSVTGLGEAGQPGSATPATTPMPMTAPSEPIPPAIGAVQVPTPPPLAPQPVLIPSTLPRAGFAIRLGALLLDVVLLAVLSAFVTSMIPRGLRFFHLEPPGMLPLLAIYGAVMWKLKGTTIGGIICGLKVVRVDNRPIDWGTAIVRALGCFLSFVVVGLGFIWVAIDDDKQSWHDKIAGTTVVHVPKGVSLL